ncbi:glycosyltransferase family 2 protein [Rhodococcus sp. BP-316]|uniref:glycosyltransferase n=1 Tax=Rhodococcus sp. BP-316 TaxID=2739445 RepID=UPI001C9A81E3|nr:glycosyltransferase family 2 protein [Rhodococcus sp. BP-316]MBY6683245.1 glycosyltransferase family 2 protein [Rhodococcus sp. BP-316]
MTTHVRGTGTGAVLLYYKLGAQVRETIRHLLAQEQSITCLVLVDNCSNDGVLSTVSQDLSDDPSVDVDIKLLTMENNLGYSSGMNAGFAALRKWHPDLLFTLFITHEVVLETDCLRQLLTCITSEQVGAVGPVLTRLNDGSVWSAGGTIDGRGNVRHRTNASDGELLWLDGACILADNNSMAAIGGFDDAYFLYWEDVDFADRMRKHAGIRCVQSAHAAQETGTAPIYYKVRGQIRFWLDRKRPVLVLLTVLKSIALIAARDLPRRDSARARNRFDGIADGLKRSTGGGQSMLRELS